MRTVGLTGGIASGKSAVLQMFGELGAQTYSADLDARAVLLDSAVLEAVFAAFPDCRNADGSLDRAALGTIVFAHADARGKLEAILHPPIRLRMRAALESAHADSQAGLLVYEVPLLFESKLKSWFDFTVATLANRELQTERLQARERLAGRPTLTDEQIAARFAIQLSAEEKANRSDYNIRTDLPINETRKRVEELYAELVGDSSKL